ncbi:MAG: argininosuccinate lyase [Ruminococcus sp.]|jgi:argininosuccinate lyase|nr:argininosuccinate lyase [Ruminococcus sp.]
MNEKTVNKINENSGKMWAGRFSKALDSKVNDFNSSFPFDRRMWNADISGSLAHAEMLGRQKIIPEEDCKAIIDGLQGIRDDILSGALPLEGDAEDIHMFIEAELTKRIGDAGQRLHTARSRNDQVALDLRLCLLDEIYYIRDICLTKLIDTLERKAKENEKTVMPGYTHLQRAQPVTMALHLRAYEEMFLRDIERLAETRTRTAVSPLGSCALAGTTYLIDREWVAKKLNLSGIVKNPLDGVSDRDFAIELAADLSILMMHLSRFSEEIILWCSYEFKFAELDDAYATGSSIMPQKKNPDITELIRGKTGRVYGDLTTLLTMMKGLPLAYNKDMQEDKEAIFDAVDTVKICLETFIPMIETMTILPENCRAAAAKGFINATDCADFLTKKGVPFRTAYKITGEIVAFCIKENLTLETMTLAQYKEFSDEFDGDIYDAVNLENCAMRRIKKN